MAVQLLPVTSSQIEALGYDEQTKALLVQFQSGDTYEYDGIPSQTAQAISNSPSPGRALHALVKSTGYSYHNLGPVDLWTTYGT